MVYIYVFHFCNYKTCGIEAKNDKLKIRFSRSKTIIFKFCNKISKIQKNIHRDENKMRVERINPFKQNRIFNGFNVMINRDNKAPIFLDLMTNKNKENE